MGMTILVALCVMAEGFLVYVLVQFVREGRRGKVARRPSSLYSSVAVRATPAREAQRKVIEITMPEGDAGDTRSGRRVAGGHHA